MLRRFLIGLLVAQALALFASTTAFATGGNYVFSGGTPSQQGQVRAALAASSFNWSLVPQQITISIGPGQADEAMPGAISLDSELLDAGALSWGVVQHEYAHQVDFFLFDAVTRARFQTLLGAADWCYEVPGLQHRQHGCERFASTLAWAYWQSPQNCMSPADVGGESAGLAPAAFRALMTSLLGASALSPGASAPQILTAAAPSPRVTPSRKRTVTR
jgi:hypothetical protein